jgi:predicted dehydrogenase
LNTPVSIASRHAVGHAEIAFACAEAGALLYVEKPFAHDSAEADVVLQVEDRSASRIAVTHLQRQVMGHEVVVAITPGRLELNPSEQSFYGEFDGRRRKRVLVEVLGE